MLWYKNTGTGGIFLKQNLTNVAEDANVNAVRASVRDLIETYKNNQQVNLGFTARQNITTGNNKLLQCFHFRRYSGFVVISIRYFVV